MWLYQKKLEFPINITNTDPLMAKAIMTQYGGPNGELAASLRYLSQRYTMPNSMGKGLLTDIGTEELAHLEMVATMIYQLTQFADPNEIKGTAYADYYAMWDKGIHPDSSAGSPFTSAYINTMGTDAIADLHEDLAAEQKARATYEYLLQLAVDPAVIAPLSFLRQREVVHFQRFGELLDNLQFDQNMRKDFYVQKPNYKTDSKK
ncbi:MAG: cotJC [Haloplasmataceae bacterium]|jgi:spore coat protein JC|nr:cotJC [Haloplasmataceae bacterium]